MARRIRPGTVGVNGGVCYGADAPFGGYKASGVGRQNGIEGFEQYLETKTIAGGLPPQGDKIRSTREEDHEGIRVVEVAAWTYVPVAGACWPSGAPTSSRSSIPSRAIPSGAWSRRD